MRLRFRRVVLLLIFLSPALTTVAEQSADVVIERDVEMKTRDGVTLRADIYHAAGDQKSPVLLQRTPYNKSNGADFARMAVARGYLVVVQDTRGRYSSDGDWYPFRFEKLDGFDTVEWAAGLPNSNGKVGMFGGSYVGATQMLAAIGGPPHLAGICPVVTASNYHENWVYQGGAFEQWFNESWTSGLAQDTLNRLIKKNTNAVEGSTALPLKDYPLFNLELPASNRSLTQQLAPYFLDWLDHPEYDGYWKQWSIEEQYESIKVPALTVTAWYDIFQGGSLRNYAGLLAHAGTATARRDQHLLITIGGHAGKGSRIGDVDFGPHAAEYDENALTLDWYDYLLQGKQNQFAGGKAVRLFVMGANQWRDEDAWPLRRATSTRYTLHSNGKANSAAGDGTLSIESTHDEPPDTYTYDPTRATPTVGGPLCCDGLHLAAGPKDQHAVESRDDVLVYTTAPLNEDLEVTGPVSLDLYAKSSAVDTDFTAKLVDVGPDGFARNLTEGIVRARYRNSTGKAELLSPGKAYTFKVDLWSTSNVFMKGHRIRLEVSSSNFPRFDRNPNTGVSGSSSTKVLPATNTILHDAEHPSTLVLPVIPR